MGSWKSVRKWLIASRPKTLVASAMPVCVAGALAYDACASCAAGKIDSFDCLPFSWVSFCIILIAAILIQAGTNFANDYFDYLKGADTHERCGPVRMMQQGDTDLKDILKAAMFCLGLASLFGIYLVYLGGMPIFLIGFFSLVCALAYTGGPFPLAYKGVADIFVLIFFGPVAVCGTYYILTNSFNWAPFLVGLSLGSITMGILVVNNLRDADSDAQVNKKTLAVRFGKSFSRWQYILLMTLGALLPTAVLMQLSHRYYLFLVLFYFFIAGNLVRRVAKKEEGESLNQVLGLTGASLCLFSLLFVVGWFV